MPPCEMFVRVDLRAFGVGKSDSVSQWWLLGAFPYSQRSTNVHVKLMTLEVFAIHLDSLALFVSTLTLSRVSPPTICSSIT